MENELKIRNFCIIAHIDHGKSTLADRFLEYTHAVDARKMHSQYLDNMSIEQERGITIKLQTARMKYNGYVLNLIDTPGHIDFKYEVSRSIAASEGAILLIDATQGIQAQTLTTVLQAMDEGLTIIPVLNKVDVAKAEIGFRLEEIKSILGFNESEVILASGRTGEGIEEILNRIIEKIPAPNNIINESKALIFDSFYDDFKGIICVVRNFGKTIQSNEKLFLLATETEFHPIEIGYLYPELVESTSILPGEVGYIATGLKDIRLGLVGDTISNKKNTEPLQGYKKIKPLVFSGIFPTKRNELKEFRDAITKLSLNDSSFSFQAETHPILGFGYKCGFLGMLHLDIFKERLKREWGVEVISTFPNCEYIVKFKDSKEEKILYSAEEFDMGNIEYVKEPMANLHIYTRDEYIGKIMEYVMSIRGTYINTNFQEYKFSTGSFKRAELEFEVPLNEILTVFYDNIRSISKGYASIDYTVSEYKASDIVKLDILANGEPINALSQIVHRNFAVERGKKILELIKPLIPRQQFKIILQASVGNKIIARETLSAFSKDVDAKLHGGDRTRRMKLWEKQKKGKERLKKYGKVEIPPSIYIITSRV